MWRHDRFFFFFFFQRERLSCSQEATFMLKHAFSIKIHGARERIVKIVHIHHHSQHFPSFQSIPLVSLCTSALYLSQRPFQTREVTFLLLVTLTPGSVCTAACRGSWPDGVTGSDGCGARRRRRREKKRVRDGGRR